MAWKNSNAREKAEAAALQRATDAATAALAAVRAEELQEAVEEAEDLDRRDLLTGAPAPGHTADAYEKWLRANGLGDSTFQRSPRERMQDLYRMAEPPSEGQTWADRA